MGLYTKQSLLAIPAASLLLIGLIRPARAAWLACGLAATGLGIAAVLMWITDGGVFRHWVLYDVNRIHWSWAMRRELWASTNLAPLIAVGLAGCWLTLPRTSGTKHARWLEAASCRLAGSALRRTGLGFGLAAACGFVTSMGMGKEGASIVYCLDWQLALCPLLGVFLVVSERLWTRPDRGMALLQPLLALLLGTTALQLGAQALSDVNGAVGLVEPARGMRLEHLREEADLVKLIASFPGPVVSENMYALLQAGKNVPFDPSFINQVTDTGMFDERPLVAKTSAKFFDAFILTSHYRERFSSRMQDAIFRNYRLSPFEGDTYQVYVRR